MIIGSNEPLYELELTKRREDAARSSQFILHAALDMVDLNQWNTQSNYLKVVDRHNEQLISAYITPGSVRFLILHEGKLEEGVRTFCGEIHEAYTKILLNPFYVPGSKITSKEFDSKVKASARRYLGYRE